MILLNSGVGQGKNHNPDSLLFGYILEVAHHIAVR
jgi:hypothetical protein